MARAITKFWHKILVLLHLSPLSLAEKCRLTFGTAIVVILILTLLIPYIWMQQLTKNTLLNAGKAASDCFISMHFRPKAERQSMLSASLSTETRTDPNNPNLKWIFYKDPEKDKLLAGLSERQKKVIENLQSLQREDHVVETISRGGTRYIDYIRIYRADEAFLSRYNLKELFGPFGRNEIVGVFIITWPASKFNLTETRFLNKIWTIFAGLIAVVGAVIVFYWITQRVILRPVRQLRALANNVAEGNLDIRSSINTSDEYEKLAEAFNHMLDNLQNTQQRLREANKQLDDKIAQLSERNIELFKANKVKGEFLANISHEFRTPLNAIIGFAEILREKAGGPSKDKNKRYAENIVTAGKSLLNMINDLLDLAKTEAGKMKLHIDRFTLPDVLDELVASFSVMTRSKKIKVKLTVADDIPELNTDAGKVRQILYNFVSNAVKFTPERGRIEIRASMLDEKTLRIAVTDTGCGIAPAEQQHIFEKFRQLDGSLTKGTPGTGLGLALSKELTDLLAGDIGLESQPDQGSTFWLEIPVNLAAKQNTDEQQQS